MSTHLNDGQLRAALDGEASPAESAHLQTCPECMRRQAALQTGAQRAASGLAFLARTAVDEPGPSSRAALRSFYQTKNPQKELSMFKRLFASGGLRLAAVALLLLVLVISIPGTRALADQLLSLFRVQQVTVIPIDFTGVQELTGKGALGKQVSEIVSNSVNVTQDPGKPVDVADAAEASKLAGFTPRLAQTETATHISVLNASAFTFTIDRTRAQTLLDEGGRSDLVLPESIDGAVVKVSVPASVSAAYGECPDPAADENAADGSGSRGRRYPDCILLTQLASPLVTAPAGVDVAQLAQIGLEFSGMSADQAQAFTSSVDWTSTLVIPIPKNAATYKQISVDGVTGTLIQRPADDAPQYLLVWVKDGVVYSMAGLGTATQRALDLANSLP